MSTPEDQVFSSSPNFLCASLPREELSSEVRSCRMHWAKISCCTKPFLDEWKWFLKNENGKMLASYHKHRKTCYLG